MKKAYLRCGVLSNTHLTKMNPCVILLVTILGIKHHRRLSMNREVVHFLLFVVLLSLLFSLFIYILSSCWFEFYDYRGLGYFVVEIVCRR